MELNRNTRILAEDPSGPVRHGMDILRRDLMGCLRNQGTGPYFYTWQRQVLYTPAQARVVLITNMENHLDDLALYEAIKQKKLQQP